MSFDIRASLLDPDLNAGFYRAGSKTSCVHETPRPDADESDH